MKTLIVFATRHGTTAACARLLADRLGADVADLRAARPRLEPYDVVLVGGPIYAGRIHPRVRRFCERSRDALLARRVGLFICCLYTGEQARLQLGDAFPPWLSSHAFASRPLGGIVRQAALGALERYMFRKLTGAGGDLERLDHAAIGELADATAKAAP